MAVLGNMYRMCML